MQPKGNSNNYKFGLYYFCSVGHSVGLRLAQSEILLNHNALFCNLHNHYALVLNLSYSFWEGYINHLSKRCPELCLIGLLDHERHK